MPRITYRNKFDRKDSLELGARAESLFVRTAKRRGWKIRPSTRHANINEHWDYLIARDGLEYKIEVKSRKRIDREDDTTQSRLTWIELHGVRPKDTGWLFGRADLIAFEREGSFILVKKTDLLELVNKKVDLVKQVQAPKDALYKIYRREGRRDKLTLVPAEDIESIKFAEWEIQ